MAKLRLREVMREKGIGQSKLSRLSGVDVRLIQRLYSDPYHNATIATLNRLAKALGVTVSELLEEDDDEENAPDNSLDR